MSKRARDAGHEECARILERVRQAARAFEDEPPHPLGLALPFLLSALLLTLSWAAPGFAWPAWVVAVALGGWCHAMLAFLAHDACHGAHCATRWGNRLVGVFCFAHCYVSFHGFQAMHRGHHRHTGFDEDPSGDRPSIVNRHGLLTYLFFVQFPLGFPIFAALPGWLALVGHNPRAYPPSVRPKIAADLVLTALFQVALFGLLGPGGYKAYVTSYFVGVWIVTQMLMFNHVGTSQFTSCVLCNTRTIVTHPLLHRLLLHGGFHVEHHALPQVPWYRLDRVHALLVREGGMPHVSPGFLALHKAILAGQFRRAFSGEPAGAPPPEGAPPGVV